MTKLSVIFRYANTTQTVYKFGYQLEGTIDYVTQVRVIGRDGVTSAWTSPIVFRVFDSEGEKHSGILGFAFCPQL